MKDVDPATVAAYVGRPAQLTPVGDTLFLFGSTGSGRALLQAGETGDPTLVRQLVNDAGLDQVRVMTAVGNRAFFTAESGLWASDGTPFGTSMLRSFPPPGPGATIVSAGGVAFFAVANGTSRELWKSNGTPAGTQRVASVPVLSLVAAGDRVFFKAPDQGLWTSDGTEAGTHRLGTVLVISDAIAPMVSAGGGILFVSDTRELWRSDGTEAGTVRVGTVAGLSGHLTPLGDVTFFATFGGGLWKTDGTDEGTVVVEPDLAIRALHDAGDTLYIHGQRAATGYELWTSDGTTAGTQVLDLCPGPCSFLTPGYTNFATLPGGVAFTRVGSHDIWRTDGSVSGTFPLASGLPGAPEALTSFGDSVYFVATLGLDPGPGDALWKTDGTPGGTVSVTMGTTGASSAPVFEGAAGERAVFSATRPDLGRELWSTAGTDASTQFVDLTPGAQAPIWGPVGSVGDAFVFAKLPSEGIKSLWTTDGTAAGTQPIPGFSPDGARSAVHGGIALFADGDEFTRRLPRTDGTIEGTFDIPIPQDVPEFGVSLDPAAITVWGTDFAAVVRKISVAVSGVWLTDGTHAARHVTIDSGECAWSAPVDERLFVFCSPGQNPSLWITDGSYGGTRLVTALPASVQPGAVALDGKLYFRLDSPSGPALWRSDGTAAGTVPLSSVTTVPGDVGVLTVSNDVLYFPGATPSVGKELWRTDGTAAGTFMLRDIDTGAASGLSWPNGAGAPILARDGGVIFAARTSATGVELWRSDGTVKGTLPLAEIAPGPASSSPGSLRQVGSRLYFGAWHGTHGREPWAIDLPPAGLSIGDRQVEEGDAGSTPIPFVVRLGAASAAPVAVSYETVAGTAQAGSDFVAVSGVLTFAPGTLELTVDVPVIGDLLDESNESFSLRVTSASGASIADGRGTVVIVDDDMPLVATSGASVVEGDSGESHAAFPVTLTTSDGQPSAGAVLVRGQVVPVTASANDFPPFGPSGPTLSFPAGTASGTTLSLLVPVRGDTLDEPNETFQVRLDTQNDAKLQTTVVVGVILDDDGLPSGAPTEIAHGSRVLTHLAAPVGGGLAADYYVFHETPFASYEVVLDGVSGDAVPLLVERVSSSGAVAQTAQPIGTGGSVGMSWLGSGATDQHLRVSSPSCGSACGADDVYRLRMYETTLTGARVNNTGSQVTIAILNNPTDRPVQASISLWADSGFATALPVAVAPRGTTVVDIAAILPDFSGSLIVTHDAPYGTVNGKVVTLDAVTGFSFETALRAKPR